MGLEITGQPNPLAPMLTWQERAARRWRPGQECVQDVIYRCPECEVAGEAREGEVLACWCCGSTDTIVQGWLGMAITH